MSQRLSIVAHMPSDNTRHLANKVLEGAVDAALGVRTQIMSPFDADAETALSSDAIILFTTENFGAMSGALKDFFERIYYPCLDDQSRNEGKPYALIIRAGIDGSGTNVGVHKIINGLKWKEAQPTLVCKGEYNTGFENQCKAIGQIMAASLEAGII